MGGESVGVLFVQGTGVALRLALPEFTLWRARCVAVIGRGAEGALFAAVADKAVFDENGEEKEDATVTHQFEFSSSRVGRKAKEEGRRLTQQQ
jgi:hypothetical protein